MWQKHKKLFFAQICAITAVCGLVMAFQRYQLTGQFREPTIGYYLLFSLMLLACEVKCLVDWLRMRRAEKTAQIMEHSEGPAR